MKILYISDDKNHYSKDLDCLIENYDTISYPLNITHHSFNNITHIIQSCEANKWARYGTMKHIGYLNTCSKDIEYFNIVDEIWVSSLNVYDYVRANYSGKISLLGHMVDQSLYNKKYESKEISEISGTYSFICSSDNEKVIYDLVEAFWGEFDPTEPVSLILSCKKISDNAINQIKKSLSLYDKEVYKRFLLIDQNLTTLQELSIIQLADCFINLNEEWDNKLIHAIGFNKPVISVNNDFDDCANIQSISGSIESIKFSMRDIYKNRPSIKDGNLILRGHK